MIALSMLAGAPSGMADEPHKDEPRKIVIAVIGDSMADGLWGGLYRALYTDPGYSLPRLGKTGSGLSHLAKFNWITGVQDVIEKEKPDIAVVSIGLNDRGSIILEHSAVAFGTPAWKTAYTERVDIIMNALKQAGIPTYWIGFPVMRDEQARADARILDQIFSERAAHYGHAYIPMWPLAGDENTYEAYSTDATGRRRLLRAEDGIHFTSLGYDLLAEKLRAALEPKLKAIASAGQPKASPAPAQASAAAAPPAPSTAVAAANAAPPRFAKRSRRPRRPKRKG